MIFYKQPIAHLLTVSINWQRLVVESVGNHQGNQLFGKLIGAVVVGSASHGNVQLVGCEVGKREQVGTGFRGGVRAAGVQWIAFIGFVRCLDTAVNFIS